MKGLLPGVWVKQPCIQGMLSVDSEHDVHWRAYGNKNLQVVLFVHGGPGSGVDLSGLCFFDPDKHYVVMFDQRGSGQSAPSGSINNNTTQHLIADIELLREALGIASWIVFGGSWGATLGLLYGQYHSKSCDGFVLRGISNSHVFQNRWMLEERAAKMPRRHFAFINQLTIEQQADPVSAHYRNILSKDVDRQLRALNAINVLESGLSNAEPEAVDSCEVLTENDLKGDAYIRAKIYLHFWANQKFVDDYQCLPNPTALADTPVIFIHGESDWICPEAGAREILKAFPQAKFISVPGAGHSPFHPGMTRALRQSLDQFANDN